MDETQRNTSFLRTGRGKNKDQKTRSKMDRKKVGKAGGNIVRKRNSVEF